MKKIILAVLGLFVGSTMFAQNFSAIPKKFDKGTIKLPSASVKTTCDTLDPIAGNDTITVYSIVDAQGNFKGYMTGTNPYFTSNGEYFTYTGTGTQLSEMYVYFGEVNDGGNGTSISVKVYTPLNDTTPGTELASTNVPLSDITTSSLTHITFSTPATISGNFIITIDDPTGNNDSIAIYSNKSGHSTPPDIALAKYNGQWYPIDHLMQNLSPLSLAIMPIICDNQTNAETAALNNVVVYPTLTSGKILFGGANNAMVDIYDITGKKVASFNNVNNHINISNLNNGVYVLRMMQDGKMLVKKIVLQK